MAVNIEKLRRDAIAARYGKMEMAPTDVIELCERIAAAEGKLARIPNTISIDQRTGKAIVTDASGEVVGHQG